MMKTTRTKGKDVTELGLGGYADDWPAEGHYQFYVGGIEVQPEKLPNMIIINLEVITGEVPGQEGKKPDLLLWYDPEHEKWSQDAMDRVWKFFWACGLYEEDNLEPSFEPADAVGKNFIGKVGKVKRKKSKTDPTKIEVIQMEEGKYWPIGHKDVEGLVKVDEDLVKKGLEKKPTEAASSDAEDDLDDI